MLKALGAVSLFAGHCSLSVKKPALARGDKCYLAGVVCLFALFAGGCIGVKVPITVAALAGLSLGVTFADLAAGCTRQTRLVLRIAIATGCCGCATLVVVGATGRGALAQVASVCFLVANSLVLVAMHAAPIQSRQGQALKVIGSACLFSGNAIGLGWHEAPPAGMIGGSMAGGSEARDARAAVGCRTVPHAGLLAAAPTRLVVAGRTEPKAKRG